MKHQEHYGRKFTQDKTTGYWLSTDYPRIRAHRWVWQHHFGVIPEGYHIHHKDEDKSNNDISNLQLMKASDHLSIHMTEERCAESAKRMNGIRDMTKAWHASPEGLAWHKYHAIKTGFGTFQPQKYTCIQCSKEFMSSNPKGAKFCHNNCKTKHRKASGIDDIKRICKCCNVEFTCNKYVKALFCNKSCDVKWRNAQPKVIRKQNCEMCGAEFIIKSYKDARFCGYSCSGRNNAKKANSTSQDKPTKA